MEWLLGVYTAAGILILIALVLGWSDWRARRKERHAH